ncbi:MAG: hypothetical protein ACK4ND_00980 [Cytophagaceae bacterium]
MHLTHAHKLPVDGGPLYAETNMDWLFMEPWNAISSLAFLIPVIYWFLKIRGRHKEYSFLTLCMALLFIGGLGSTFYHAFRTSPYLLMMDVLPIQLLTLLVSMYLWLKVLRRWYYIIPILFPLLIVKFMTFNYFESFIAVNAAYFVTGTMIFFPALILLVQTNFENSKMLILGMVFFVLSLLCRYIDHQITFLLPMGSHWLWHVFGAIGSGYLGAYLYGIAHLQLSERKFAEIRARR